MLFRLCSGNKLIGGADVGKYPPKDFIRNTIAEDNKTGKFGSRVHTRFPPEPNGYLHIGHSKSICLNFGVAKENGGKCNLRFDDTNPVKEDQEFVDAIKEDIRWLGFDWEDREFYASDYFEQMYEFARELIRKDKAFVCDLSAEEMREYRGTLTEPGKESPFRNRSVDENLTLFEKMKNGEFDEGSRLLRAKIDMSSGNINLRDPALYRIKKAHHHRTGDEWCIYPMYDYAHCLGDSIENITHSLCTLEFQDHRPLYDWVLDELGLESHPQQIEFARLNINYTVMSKRKLKQLVDEKHVSSWDDPRMPTISGMRNRGYPAAAVRKFNEGVGISKSNSIIDFALLEEAVRNELNESANRAMGVLDPIKIVIEDYPEDKIENLSAPNHPQKENRGRRELSFSRELYIERNDFLEDAPSKFFRLKPGGEVRLRNAYVVKCEKVIKDGAGKVVELRCSHDANTLGKKPEGRKVKGIIHWVCAKNNFKTKVHLYDRLFKVPEPGGDNFLDDINPDSLVTLENCYVEAGVKDVSEGAQFQFERLGYFTAMIGTSGVEFKRTVTLKDSWAKEK